MQHYDVIIAGGLESMTNTPHILPKLRSGQRLGHTQIYDHMFLDGLEDAYDKGRLMGTYAEDPAPPPDVATELAAELHLMAGWLGLDGVVVEEHPAREMDARNPPERSGVRDVPPRLFDEPFGDLAAIPIGKGLGGGGWREDSAGFFRVEGAVNLQGRSPGLGRLSTRVINADMKVKAHGQLI